MALEAFLNHEDGTKKMVKDCIDIVKKSDGIVIFGAGVGGAALYNIIRDEGMTEKILAFSDNNELKIGRSYCENRLIIEDPKALFAKYGHKVTILIGSSAYDLIRNQLICYGFDGNRIFLYNFAFMDVKYTDCAFIYDHIEEFERAYSKLSDDKSRRIFTDILNYRITKEQKHLEHMDADVDDEHFQYFDKHLFNFSEDEVMLDVGAYTGDTFKVYDEVYDKWEGYIGLEADPKVYKILQETVNESGQEKKAELFNVAAWDENTTLVFSTNPGSSTVSLSGDGLEVRAAVSDDILKDKKVSFIKMDIEGAEYHALCGLKRVIQLNKPICAICAYHLRDDFYKLTDLIEDIAPEEYSYYFRQYRYTPTETVCYAIPKKRKITK